MWADAQRDGRLDAYWWRPLLNDVQQIAKMSLLCNLRTKKRRAFNSLQLQRRRIRNLAVLVRKIRSLTHVF